MARLIELAVSETISTTEQGRLLEQLGREILEAMQYDVTMEVRLTGMEVDLLAKHRISGDQIYVECKAHKDPLSASVIKDLLGSVVLNGVSSGWLLTTGPLGKDANGIKVEWEERSASERKRLQIYTPDRLIDLMVSSGRICNVDTLQGHNGDHHGGNPCLLITNYGRFWAIPLIHVDAGRPYAIRLFDAKTGTPISDAETLDNLSRIDSSYKDLEWISGDSGLPTVKPSFMEEATGVVNVAPGDEWADYRPSRPQDFVGREEIQSDVFRFLDSVRSTTTNTRILAIKAPSGLGKSSILLKLIDKSRNKRYRGKYFIYAVDVRAALSHRYAEFSLLACIRAAMEAGFITRPTIPLVIPGVDSPFSDNSMIEILQYLKAENKVIVLFFDQFEEVFSKRELQGLFESIRKLSTNVDALQENFVLGYAWKSDVSIPAEHPAYSLWHNLSDRRREFSLTPFVTKDIVKALNIFSRILGSPLHPSLKRYLVDHCQGYPWLLKKLSIHVHSLIRSGASQVDTLGSNLQIKELFEKDLNELTGPEVA